MVEGFTDAGTHERQVPRTGPEISFRGGFGGGHRAETGGDASEGIDCK